MKRITSIIVISALVLSALVFTTGCTKGQEVDLSEYLSYEGFSGFATLNEQPEIKDYDKKYDDLKEKRKEAREDDDDSKYDDYTEEMKSLRNLNNALECVEFKLVKGENGKLANGDTIKVKAKYNEEKVEKYDVTFVADEFEVKVKGLEEKEVVDPFDSKNFTLTFSGMSGYGIADVDDNDDSKDYTIDYSVDPSYDLSNGDTVTITASLYDEDYILKDSEDGEEATKEFTVEGLGEIPFDLDSSVDTTFASEAIIEAINEYYDAEVGSIDYGVVFGMENDNFDDAEIKINKVSDFKLEKTLYGYGVDDNYNKSCIFAQIYSRTFTVKIIEPGYDSNLKYDATKSVTAYYLGSFYEGELMVSDNKLVLIDEDEYYDDCLDNTNSYESVADAQEDFEEDYSDEYTITEVK